MASNPPGRCCTLGIKHEYVLYPPVITIIL